MKLFWLDLETTGLNPREDHVLEIAVSEADLSAPFEAREVFHAVLSLPYVKLDPFIVEMHTKNGLLEECAGSTGTPAWVDAHLLDIIPEVQDKEDRPVLAGNSVHFDLGFLRHHMPRAAARLSHRVYDVSAITLFARSLGMPHTKGDPAHRARDDVRASIRQAAKVTSWLYSP